MQQLDLSTRVVVPLRRRTPFSAQYADDAYIFDPISPAEMDHANREAGMMAAPFLDEDIDEWVWLVAEARHAKFGHEVPAVDVDEDEKFKSVREKGTWTPKPDEEIYVVRVAKDELDAWWRAKSGGGDIRLIGNFRDGAGWRNFEFRRAVELMTQTAFDDFPRDGERAMKQFLDAVVNGAGTSTSYHSGWARASGVFTARRSRMSITCSARRYASGPCTTSATWPTARGASRSRGASSSTGWRWLATAAIPTTPGWA